jgi:hypothetical protein
MFIYSITGLFIPERLSHMSGYEPGFAGPFSKSQVHQGGLGFVGAGQEEIEPLFGKRYHWLISARGIN